MLERAGRLPDVVVACVGGGSNAIGMLHPLWTFSRPVMLTQPLMTSSPLWTSRGSWALAGEGGGVQGRG